MIEYINKNALIAEFNRLIAELIENGGSTMFEQGRISAFEDAKLFLDTLVVKGANLKQETEYPFKSGDKVIIHCGTKRHSKIRFELFNDKVGTILYVGKLENNPWGNIGVVIDGGYNDAFYVEELELVPKEE